MSKTTSLINFIKKETVLCVAVFLAVLSAFIVPPDRQYIDYIDFRTLAVLFCLMAVMAGLKAMNVFDYPAKILLKRSHSIRSMGVALWGMCFFFSMLITNDVALITFVPLTLIILDMLGDEYKKRYMIKLIVMQTIAANLGSMLTPVGNPQNLYLYSAAGMTPAGFVRLMLPYTTLSLVLLIAMSFTLPGKAQPISVCLDDGKSDTSRLSYPLMLGYMMMFLLSLLTVCRIVSYPITLAAVVVFLILADRKTLLKIDYPLLITFVGFFVFIGNIGRFEEFRGFIEKIISGNEVITAAVASQIVSNVPAALLLSGFTNDFASLIIGTDIGGMGTLIASMASLISFKYVARDGSVSLLRYLAYFTVANVVFLASLLAMYFTIA